jgi:hypothetical protein
MSTAAKYKTEIQGPIGSHTVIVSNASNNFLAVEFWCKPWGTLSNDAVWVAYTLNGKLCLGSLEHFYAGKAEAITVALKAIDDKDGGQRVYLSHFHDSHMQYDTDGNFCILYDNEHRAVLIYLRADGKDILKTGPAYEYPIDPEQHAMLVHATRNGSYYNHI